MRIGLERAKYPHGNAGILDLVEGAAAPDKGLTFLAIVHPGSACGSADFNLGGEAEADRAKLTAEIAGWHGGVFVIDDVDRRALAKPRYRALGEAIDAALARARAAAGCPSVRVNGPDPKQIAFVRRLVAELGLKPGSTAFRVTGAWYHRKDGSGCVGSVVGVLRDLGYAAKVGGALWL